MFQYYEITPAYHHIYLKNLSLSSEEMIDINTVNYTSGFAASAKEIAVFTQDTDLNFVNQKPVKVFITSDFVFHPADEGMIKVYSGDFMCSEQELVLCNVLTMNTAEAVKVAMDDYSFKNVFVEVYVDHVGNAGNVVFSFSEKQ